jgi:hypothetical protein
MKIFLNRYRMYGSCSEDCPYDFPDRSTNAGFDPANIASITHEFGHTLGLGHVANINFKGNLMFLGEERWYQCGTQSPAQKEIDFINTLYP